MSTSWHIACTVHDEVWPEGDLRHWNIPVLRRLITEREAVIRICDEGDVSIAVLGAYGGPVDDWLRAHIGCPLGIRNEYGDWEPES